MTFLGSNHKFAQQNLFNLPTTPHSDNDEFNSAELNSAWVFSNETPILVTPAGTDITNSYGSTSGNVYYSLNKQRRSWLMFQNGVSIVNMHKPITLATNTLIIARLQCRSNVNYTQDNEVGIGIAFSGETGGLATPAVNCVSCNILDCDPGARQAEFAKITSVTFTSIGATTNTSQQIMVPEYVAIHKIGTTYHGWVAPSNGNWTWMGSTTHATTFTRLNIRIANGLHNQPGSMLTGVDFIRRFDTDQFIF